MSSGRLILLIILIAAVAGFVDRASAATMTLPLDGYFRVGRYMPVHVAGATNGQIVGGTGIVPVRLQTSRASIDAIVPVLMISAAPSFNMPGAPAAGALHSVDTDQRLVGLVGLASEADARRLFPGRDVIPIHMDWPLPLAAMAYEALDGIVIADAPPPDEPSIIALLGAGVAFSTRSAEVPDQRWPWRRDGEFWTLRYNPLGPRDCFHEPDALLASYTPGISLPVRLNLVLLTTIFIILSIGTTLLPQKSRLIVVVCVVAAALAVMLMWTNAQSAVRSAGGEVVVMSSGLAQQDFWSCQVALRPTVVRLSGGGHPLLADWSQAVASQMTMVWQDDGPMTFFEYHASAGMKIASLVRIVQPQTQSSMPVNNLHRSPLRLVLDELYLKDGAHIVGEGPDISQPAGSTWDRWPTVVIDASKPGAR